MFTPSRGSEPIRDINSDGRSGEIIRRRYDVVLMVAFRAAYTRVYTRDFTTRNYATRKIAPFLFDLPDLIVPDL